MRAFGRWYRQFGWFEGLSAMPLAEWDIAVVEFASLDHLTCIGELATCSPVVPAVGSGVGGR